VSSIVVAPAVVVAADNEWASGSVGGAASNPRQQQPNGILLQGTAEDARPRRTPPKGKLVSKIFRT